MSDVAAEPALPSHSAQDPIFGGQTRRIRLLVRGILLDGLCSLLVIVPAAGCHLHRGYLAEYEFTTEVKLAPAAAGPMMIDGTTFRSERVDFEWMINDYVLPHRLDELTKLRVPLRTRRPKRRVRPRAACM